MRDKSPTEKRCTFHHPCMIATREGRHLRKIEKKHLRVSLFLLGGRTNPHGKRPAVLKQSEEKEKNKKRWQVDIFLLLLSRWRSRERRHLHPTIPPPSGAKESLSISFLYLRHACCVHSYRTRLQHFRDERCVRDFSSFTYVRAFHPPPAVWKV